MTFPILAGSDFSPTRDALHAYARVLGDWLMCCRLRRKHWWHASLRPSLHGLSTGVVYGATGFELELNLADSVLAGHTSRGTRLREPLHGQSAAALGEAVARFLAEAGVQQVPAAAPEQAEYGYSADQAKNICAAFRSVAAAMSEFRAGIREETSPIQLWPHHFDLAMLWLPGEKIASEDPADEESADKQMNFGFTLGDAGIPEPYFYITAYPRPPALLDLPLAAEAHWHTAGFTGAVLPYARLREQQNPGTRLLTLWRELLRAGQTQMSTTMSL